jgi:GDPmannose 4,6-dehydratase
LKNNSKKAIITGITGQDGAYLTDLLIKKGYIVHGIKRRSSLFNTQRIDNLFEKPEIKNKKLFLHYGDLTDSTNIIRIIQEVQPDEIYNLGAMSHVHVSFEAPVYTANTDGIGTLRILEAVRLLGLIDKTKIYQASTSELFGLVQETPQNEKTPFYPRSPYGVAKLFGYWSVVNYRESYNLFACNGILFNHESPLRGETFVSRKITRGLANIILGNQKYISLGNLDAERDWGHAKDYVLGMYLMLQHKEPIDFVLSTGIKTSVRDFVILAFNEIGVEIKFQGEGLNEKGIVFKNSGKYNLKKGHEVIKVDSQYYRPSEVDLLLGDSSKAKEILGWIPKYDLKMLVKEMVSSDIDMVINKKNLYNF